MADDAAGFRSVQGRLVDHNKAKDSPLRQMIARGPFFIRSLHSFDQMNGDFSFSEIDLYPEIVHIVLGVLLELWDMIQV
jgi:hypothetical protein